MTGSRPPPGQVRVVRDGVVESAHRVVLAAAADDGAPVGSLGDVDEPVYPRSAVKPFQARAVLDLLDPAGVSVDAAALAVACASHAGRSEQQACVLRLLGLAGLDPAALRCPPAWPADLAALRAQPGPTSLAHNCSGKHAAMLLGQVAAAGDPGAYLDADAPVQRLVRRRLEAAAGARPEGPGVDGCGAPAWRLPLRGLATAFARLAAADRTDDLRPLLAAMTAHADLVGGPDCADTALMRAEPRVVAKRGAEGVLAAGLRAAGHGGAGRPRAIGVAVKVVDGAPRAAAPAVATALRAAGAAVPEALVAPVVLGGGRPHGRLSVDARVAAVLA